ncbi:chitin deacetylase 7-like [Ruditapes philippinarum]|uniref:chitin deacetylase 7-like n=1 Tax=Ruditapes philippinarum TaxID=129788 RepID=UPI00295BF58B|nr:chitin deacetylase 7-like [Ruditapes philippinarum]
MRLSLLLLSALVGLSLQQCDPKRCTIPNCRCYDDRTIPGSLSKSETPQIVMVSFEGTINSDNIKDYLPIFQSVTNPNNCPARGTFFIEDSGTAYDLVKDISSDGHEIGISSVDGNAPSSSTGWIDMIKKVSSELEGHNIDLKEVKGVRAPQLAMGGNAEMTGIGSSNLLYDSSCSSVSFSSANTLIWPYTFDYMPTAACDNGNAPTLPFPGRWEVPIADLHDINGDKLPCVVPSGCRNITTKRDAFDIFFNAFAGHYNGNRAPFLMIVDPSWASNQDKRDGTAEFLQYIRSAFTNEVWIVPIQKALEWIQKPVPIAELNDFAPWQCK